MPRIARVVAPGVPHHITQRGNRRQRTFFNEEDYRAYIRLMAMYCTHYGVDIWAYCLMPNHVHMMMVPRAVFSLSRAVGEAHRRYTLRINRRNGWTGYLWQGRFSSFPLDGSHLLNAARYIELNPLRAGLAASPGEYVWSSARAHLLGEDDHLVKSTPLLDIAGNWRELLSAGIGREEAGELRLHSRTGRPLGDDDFVEQLEALTGRELKRKKPGGSCP